MGRLSGIIAGDEWRRYGSMMPTCVLGIALLTVPNYTLGAMIGPIEREFGWSRAEISAGALFPSFAAIALSPLAGIAVDRFGSRVIALLGVPLFCLALALLSTATASIYSWWVLYGLVGIASMLVSGVVWTAAINTRFRRNRGLAMALALAGMGISAAIMPAMATELIAWHGWRVAYVGIATIFFAILFPLVFFLFDCATDAPSGGAPRAVQRDPGRVRQVLRTRSCLMLAGAAFVFSASANILATNAVPVLLGEGFSPLDAARMAGLVGIGSIVGRLGGGLLLDRIDARFVAIGSGVAPIIGAILLLGTQGSEASAMLACLGVGLAGGAEYDACAYLAARHFASRDFGTVFGLIGGLSIFGGAIAPVIANRIYDVTHSYDLVLWAAPPAFVAAALLFLLIGPYPAGDRHD